MKGSILQRDDLLLRIGALSPSSDYNTLAMDVCQYQLQHNPIYQQYARSFTDTEGLQRLSSPIYLPISAFKNYNIKSGHWTEDVVFTSSGTTGQAVSRHACRDVTMYTSNCVKGWEHFYGPVSSYKFLCLLPGYLEREGSSLITMMKHFVDQSEIAGCGFYLRDYEALLQELKRSQHEGDKTVLLGVSYALLDFASDYNLYFPDLIVMETGGMKGQRQEMLKDDLHTILRDAFGVRDIHSEYGMTELFSQAYSKENALFAPSPTMRIDTTEITDPFSPEKKGKTGVICITDLANLDSCSFIRTEDLGVSFDDGTFKLMGRLDHADIRGCNLMIQ